MHRIIKPFLALLFLMAIFAGCKKDSRIVSYIKILDTSQVDVVYTDRTDVLNKKLKAFDIKHIPGGLAFVKPYNTVLVLLDTTLSQNDIQEYFPFAKVVRYKKSLIVDNSLSGMDIESFLKEYSGRLELPSRIFTNKPGKIMGMKLNKKVERFSRKCYGSPCKPYKGYKSRLREERKQVELGYALGIYFFDTDTSVYPSIKEIKNQFRVCNIIRLSDGFVLMPVFYFSHTMLDSLKSFLSSDTDIIRVYANRYFIKTSLPKSVSFSWIPMKKVKGAKNKRYDKLMKNMNLLLERDKVIVFYFYNNVGDVFPTQEELQKYLGNQIFYSFPQGLIIRSRFYKTPPIVDSLVSILRSDSLISRIYTNKVYLLKAFLEKDSIKNISIIWEPRTCIVKDTMCYPLKDFNSRMYRYKLDVEARRALWIHFKDPTQRTFPKVKYLKSYLANSFDLETDYGVLFSSPYRNSQTLKALKQEIIPIYNNPEFKIYSNKVYILQHLLDTGYVYFHLPMQYLLPSYERNERLDIQLQKVKQEIIVNNAVMVYMKDPTDSIYPSEGYIRERFKYLKFYNFKDGFVIGAYLGD